MPSEFFLRLISLCKVAGCGTIGFIGITAQQFKEMQQRVGGVRRLPAVASPATPPPLHQVILGIDPSLRGTGYGVIRCAKPASQLIAQGTITCPSHLPRSECLRKIGAVLKKVLQEHQPTVCVIEGLFYAQNIQTALLMGEARGAALLAIAEAGLEIYEMAPRKVKQAIVGYGAAQKSAVAKMVQRMLLLDSPPAPDAADALALALAHVQARGPYALAGAKRI